MAIPRSLQLSVVVDAVRQRRPVADGDFDRIYPTRIRLRSSQFWTPVEVAQRAAAMLVNRRGMRVLDVGSGVGKFCLVGALTSGGLFTGVEQRGELAELAGAIARAYGVGRATYVSGDMRDVDWDQFDGFYFFNPFAENYFIGADRFDDSVELTPQRFDRDLRFVVAQLALASVGTRVVTYHGIGRGLPPGYVRLGQELAGTDILELWVKT